MAKRRNPLMSALASVKNSPPKTTVEASERTSLTDMLGALGLALIFSNNPVSDASETLQSVAAAYGRRDLRIVCLPTFVLIEDPTATKAQTSLFPANDMNMLRLEQAGAVQSLVHRAANLRLDPDEVVRELQEITDSPPRFGFWRALLGHTLLTVGFGLVMNPTLSSLPIYVVLGVIVGVVVILGSRARTLALVLPVFAAFVATGIVGMAINMGLIKVDAMLLIAPAVVILLPGLALVLAAVELANGQLISGASRFIYGFAQLGMLAFGVYIGIVLFKIQLTFDTTSDERLGNWAPWLGIVIVGFGYFLYSVAPKRSILWVIFALSVAHAGQLLGIALIGSALSGMIGAIIAIPIIYLVSHLASAPPAAVMLPCAYWVLVPGSMGFIGLTEAASHTDGAGNALLQTLGAIIAIAIGMVIGAGISRDTGTFARAWHRSHREYRGNRHDAKRQASVDKDPAKPTTDANSQPS